VSPGVAGVGIEDMVIVRPGGGERLTLSPWAPNPS
jgi:Xaa-Pro aminopeptidase